MVTHSSILAQEIPWTEEPGGLYSPWGHKESDTTEHARNQIFTSQEDRTPVAFLLHSKVNCFSVFSIAKVLICSFVNSIFFSCSLSNKLKFYYSGYYQFIYLLYAEYNGLNIVFKKGSLPLRISESRRNVCKQPTKKVSSNTQKT